MNEAWKIFEKVKASYCELLENPDDTRKREERDGWKATFTRAQTEDSKLQQKQHLLLHWPMKGVVIRIVLVAGNLLVDPTSKYMWAPPPSIPPLTCSRELLINQCNLGPMRISAPSSQATKNDDDSTWWLTHCLLSRTHAPTPQPPRSRSTGTLSYKRGSTRTSREKEEEKDQSEWAITRLLVPRRFQRPASGEQHPPLVPGRPPARMP